MNARSTRSRARLATLALGLCGVGWSAPAHACDMYTPPTGPNCPVEPPLDVGEVREPVRHSSVAGKRLSVEDVEVRRSRYIPPDEHPCGATSGGAQLELRLQSFDEWPEDVGLRVEFPAGSYFAPERGVTVWQWLPADGTTHVGGEDDPRQPMDATVILTAVDCAGAETAPLE